MGNGALPNGLSYRAHPRLYQTGQAELNSSMLLPGITCLGNVMWAVTQADGAVNEGGRELSRKKPERAGTLRQGAKLLP